MYAQQLVKEQNLAQQQHADHIVLNDAQCVEQEKQHDQNLVINQNNVAVHNHVPHKQAAEEDC